MNKHLTIRLRVMNWGQSVRTLMIAARGNVSWGSINWGCVNWGFVSWNE